MACPGASGADALRVLSFRTAKILLCFVYLASFAREASAQAIPYARNFTMPRAQVDQAKKVGLVYSGQNLPGSRGLGGEAEKPLDRYERGFYQFSIEPVPG